MSKIETIEQRVFRLGRVMHGKDTLSFADALNDRNFKLACKLVELALAEEREACVQKAALWALTKDMSSNLRLGLASAIRGRTYSADKGKQDRKGMT